MSLKDWPSSTTSPFAQSTTDYAKLQRLINSVRSTRLLYVECDYTDRKMFQIAKTRIVVGPRLADLSIVHADAVRDTCEVLPVESGDVNRGAKLIEYGDGVYDLPPLTEPIMLMKDDRPKMFLYTKV